MRRRYLCATPRRSSSTSVAASVRSSTPDYALGACVSGFYILCVHDAESAASAIPSPFRLCHSVFQPSFHGASEFDLTLSQLQPSSINQNQQINSRPHGPGRGSLDRRKVTKIQTSTKLMGTNRTSNGIQRQSNGHPTRIL